MWFARRMSGARLEQAGAGSSGPLLGGEETQIFNTCHHQSLAPRRTPLRDFSTQKGLDIPSYLDLPGLPNCLYLNHHYITYPYPFAYLPSGKPSLEDQRSAAPRHHHKRS